MFFKLSFDLLSLCFTALDARLEVGLEQQAELMLKMMATLQADSILQALTSNSSTGILETQYTFQFGFTFGNTKILLDFPLK